jgi:uncharacterized protein YPO0396
MCHASLVATLLLVSAVFTSSQLEHVCQACTGAAHIHQCWESCVSQSDTALPREEEAKLIDSLTSHVGNIIKQLSAEQEASMELRGCLDMRIVQALQSLSSGLLEAARQSALLTPQLYNTMFEWSDKPSLLGESGFMVCSALDVRGFRRVMPAQLWDV